jgi:hypothetical protein
LASVRRRGAARTTTSLSKDTRYRVGELEGTTELRQSRETDFTAWRLRPARARYWRTWLNVVLRHSGEWWSAELAHGRRGHRDFSALRLRFGGVSAQTGIDGGGGLSARNPVERVLRCSGGRTANRTARGQRPR